MLSKLRDFGAQASNLVALVRRDLFTSADSHALYQQFAADLDKARSDATTAMADIVTAPAVAPTPAPTPVAPALPPAPQYFIIQSPQQGRGNEQKSSTETPPQGSFSFEQLKGILPSLGGNVINVSANSNAAQRPQSLPSSTTPQDLLLGDAMDVDMPELGHVSDEESSQIFMPRFRRLH